MTDPSISVIVPVGPAENDLTPMLEQLPYMATATEIVFVFCPESAPLQAQLDKVEQANVRSQLAGRGRAVQMNQAADACHGEYLWFLHLDSRFGEQQWQCLYQSLKQAPQDLHYFNLYFETDGAGPVWLNARGANLRSRLLGLPFGDQGFCLSASLFKRLGGYPEQAPYGEDHLLVWAAHKAGIRLQNTGTALRTSARKYGSSGWLKLTLRYQYYWLSQALPELWQLLKIRITGKKYPDNL